MDPSRLAHLRIDALDRLVQAMMKEHLALAAGVESRLAAIESVLTREQPEDAGLADRTFTVASRPGSAWVQWAGETGCPLLPGTKVEVVFKGSVVGYYVDRFTVQPGLYADSWSWMRSTHVDHILAYRIVDLPAD